MDAQQARASARRWIICAAVLFVIRVVAYMLLSPPNWDWFDFWMPSAAAWGCIAMAAWRRGYASGLEKEAQA